MTRMTGPDCAVMYNLINTHTHTRSTVCVKICMVQQYIEIVKSIFSLLKSRLGWIRKGVGQYIVCFPTFVFLFSTRSGRVEGRRGRRG